MAPRALLLLLAALGPALPGARGSWDEASVACPSEVRAGAWRRLRFLWLRPDGAAPVVVESEGARADGRLVGCAWRAGRARGRSSRALCRAGGRGGAGRGVSWGPRLRGLLDALDARKFDCAGAPEPPGGRGGQAHLRTRRGLTVPGTAWCGLGNTARDASELGVFQGPDECCHEHDTCGITITSLEYKYGIRNYYPYTISDCSCDKRFRTCLRNRNDAISNLIGSSFFNLLEIPCFHLKETKDCLEWKWWGECSKYGLMQRAELVEPGPYEPIESPDMVTSPPHPRRHQKPRLEGRNVRRKKGKKLRPKAQSPVTPRAPASRLNRPVHDPGTNSPAPSRRCRCYQRLDQCPFQIGPNELRYQLHNSDHRRLFHCDCTRRLARLLRRRKGPNEVEEQLLSQYIAPSCFVLETVPSCRMGDESWPNCIGIDKAVLAPARHLTKRLAGRWARASFKLKRQERASLRGAPRLFDKCVRLVRAALRPVAS